MNDLVINSISDIEKMATVMSKSGLFKKTPDQMFALMLIAQAEGIHPAIAAQEYDIIDGKPALKGQSALARFQQAGGSIVWKTRTEAEATATFTHPQGGSLTVTWTMERATRMGLAGKDNWRKQQGTMLSWRTVSEGIRMVYPACLNRMYLVEEVVDFENTNPEPRNVTPEPATFTESEPEAKPEAKAEADPWLAEWQKRVGAIAPIVAKWPKADRDKMLLNPYCSKAREDKNLMDIAEIRVRIYEKYKKSEFIANVIDAMISFENDKEKLLAYETTITVPVAEAEEKKGEEADAPAETEQLF